MPARRAPSRRPAARSPLRRILRALLLVVAGYYALCIVGLVYLRFLPPVTTGVQMQRRVESWFTPGDYTKRSTFRAINAMSPHLPHAVVAAEDARYYEHHGFDWEELRDARERAQRGGRMRGASTITQQLVKNLFLTTHRSFVRKGIEYTLTPLAELILGKRRILELYLNVIEWGPGVYGAEAAARHHYGKSASSLTRDQSARLAAVIPNPRQRKPARMGWYARIILGRMTQMGW
jgi:monofunctional biosynthetic peptidoglycan transglycosylase